MFLFWSLYLDVLPNDLCSERNTALFLELGTLFFTLHPRCSIRQMQYLFAITLSEQYENRLGHSHLALHWLSKAIEFSDSEEQKHESEYKRRLLLLTSPVRVLDDPQGLRQMEWNIARRKDLEELFREQEKPESEQFECAVALLRLQLEAEADAKRELTGEPWLCTAKSILPFLPENSRRVQNLRLDYTVAHKLYESGAIEMAIQRLMMLKHEDKKNEGNLDDREMEAQILFTLGRAQLELYNRNNDLFEWQGAREALEKSLKIAIDLHRPDIVACCQCVLASLWICRGSDENSTSTALEHVEEAERLWKTERGGYRNLGGLDGLLTRYSLRVRNEF